MTISVVLKNEEELVVFSYDIINVFLIFSRIDVKSGYKFKGSAHEK
ncbi:MAG: hypothetical protein IJ677_09520 [Alphaproteobacteria bacterium]|nr:hypothetical protein [Alphaproteobacteria bacterium]MBR1601796.1 hypothetical protein [Alphaproteobacteria bacterium]